MWSKKRAKDDTLRNTNSEMSDGGVCKRTRAGGTVKGKNLFSFKAWERFFFSLR